MIDLLREQAGQDPPCMFSVRDTSRKKRNIANSKDSLWRYYRAAEPCSQETVRLSHDEAVQPFFSGTRLCAASLRIVAPLVNGRCT